MDVGSLIIKIIADSRQLDMGLNSAEKKLLNITQSVGKVGKSLTMGLTLPLVGAGVAISKMAMDFETNMTNVYTLMDDATIASQDWEKEILDLSKEFGESTDSMSKGLYDIVSSGIPASDALGLLETATIAAKAGLSDTATSVAAITAVINAYGMSAEDATKISDIMFQTVNYGVVTFPELASSIGGVISSAAEANVSFEEVGAAIATMTLSGLTADEAVTALNQTILSFIRPTDQARAAAEKLGFKLDATNLAAKGLPGVFSELSEKIGITVEDIVALEEAGVEEGEMWDELARRTGANIEILAELFPNVRALKGALNLARNEGEDFTEMLGRMKDSSGAASAAYAKQAQTTKHTWDVAVASLKAAAITMGNELLPMLTKVLEWVAKVADKFSELPDPAKKFVLALGGIVAIVPPLMWAAGNIANLTIKLKALRTAAIAANGAMSTGLLITLGQIAGAAGGAALALVQTGDSVQYAGSNTDKLHAATFGWYQATRRSMPEGSKLTKELAQSNYELLSQIMDLSEEYPELADKTIELTDQERNQDITAQEYNKRLKELIQNTEEAGYTEGDRTDKIKELNKTLTAYSYSNDTLMGQMVDLELFYNKGQISEENYIAVMEALVEGKGKLIDATGNEYETMEDYLAVMGLLPEAYYEGKKAADELANSVDEGTGAINEQKKSLEELMDTLFKFYNKNANVVESIWAYQDASAELDKWLSENKDLTEDQIRNSREYAEKVLGINKEIQNMVGNITDLVTGNEELDVSQLSVIQQFKSVREAMIHAGLAAVQMKSISYAEFEMWANNVGISTSEVAEYIRKVYDEYGTMPNLVETEIIAEDLASDTVEAIVGDLNNLDERPNVSVGIEAKDLTFDTIKTILNNLSTLREDANIPVEAKNLITPVIEDVVKRLNAIRNEPNIDIPVEVEWLTGTVDALAKDLDDLRNAPGVDIPIEVEDLITDTIEEITKELDTLNSMSTMIPVEVAPEDKEKVNYDLEYWQNYPIEDKTIKTEVESKETEIKLDELDYYRIGEKKFKVTADDQASKTIEKIQQLKIGDKTFNITGKVVGSSIGNFGQGGIAGAQEGLNAKGNKAMPIMIHPPELILNKDQALNVLWNMGQVRNSSSANFNNNRIDLSGKIQIELSGDGAENLSESLLSDIITERMIRHFKEEGARR